MPPEPSRWSDWSGCTGEVARNDIATCMPRDLPDVVVVSEDDGGTAVAQPEFGENSAEMRL